MKFTKFFIKGVFTTFIILFSALLILFSSVGRDGVARGILLCGRVIIPSLFPFTMCVIFITKSGVLDYLKFLTPITNKIFGLNFHEFSYFLLSLVGGYPIGAKLLNEAVKEKKIHPKKAADMLHYCINAGPAFIISAVGGAVFGSEKIGVVLLISHIAASLILCLFSKKNVYSSSATKTVRFSPVDNFVVSAAEASNTLISICGFVILFSAIDSFMLYFGEKLKALKTAALFLEITNALEYSRNVYLLSFLLGFGGICIWCQVISAGKNLKINLLKFAVLRILHGILSTGFTYAIIKTFKIVLPTVTITHFKPVYSTPAVTLSLLIMGIVFVTAVSSKKYNCKLLDDIV